MSNEKFVVLTPKPSKNNLGYADYYFECLPEVVHRVLEKYENEYLETQIVKQMRTYAQEFDRKITFGHTHGISKMMFMRMLYAFVREKVLGVKSAIGTKPQNGPKQLLFSFMYDKDEDGSRNSPA